MFFQVNASNRKTKSHTTILSIHKSVAIPQTRRPTAMPTRSARRRFAATGWPRKTDSAGADEVRSWPRRSEISRAVSPPHARIETEGARGGGGWEAGVEKAPQQRDRDMDWAGEGEGAMAAGPYLLLLPSLCGEKFGACGAHLKYGLLHPS